MKAPLMAFLILIALIVGSAVTVKMACENGQNTWCVPEGTSHHVKAR
jgi:hypothetical protein